MILVYTGQGKGKTCACVGQALRAFGQGLTVYFAQFIKRDHTSGEQEILGALLGERFYGYGAGFVHQDPTNPLHKEAAASVLRFAKLAIPVADLVVLDESLYALQYGLIEEQDVRNLIATASSTHLVFSGRTAPDWLIDAADLVTTFLLTKHPFRKGTPAQPGIEF